MKNNKHIVPIALGAAMLMVLVASTISVPKAPSEANSGDKATPIILASAQSLAAPRANMAAAETTQPELIPVPCPIWMLGQITGYGKTANQSADGAASSPKLVPGGIWFMQKFSEVARKTL